MKRSVGLWQLWGFAFTVLAGTLLHFLYDWLGKAIWVAPFSSVNESTFEHMKILFFPTLIFAVVQSFFFEEQNKFWCIKLRGISLALIFIPVLFYTYNGAIGKSPDWVNIAIFFISAAIGFIYEAKLLKSGISCFMSNKSCIFVLCVMAALFILFTFKPLEIGIFKDPITNSYGII
jgi:hypothetical protein